MSVPVQTNSSGIHEMPTPRRKRSPESAAIDATCLATSNGWRSGSLRTLVRNVMRSVTAAIAGMATKGSRKGVSGGHHRAPSAENG
jgi:hypothetical protein